MCANLQEDLVGDIVVRPQQHLGQDLRQGAGLAVHMDGLKSLGNGSDRYLAFNAAAGLSDKDGEKLAGVAHADRRIFLGKADAAASVWAAFKELAYRQRCDRGLLFRGADGFFPF